MILAQVKLEQVFESTRQNFNQSHSGSQWLPLLIAVAALAAVLIVLHYRRQRETLPQAVKSPRRLLREINKMVPLRSAELKQLRALAEEQNCQSPLTLLLCPSLLTKAVGTQPSNDRKTLLALLKRFHGKQGA